MARVEALNTVHVKLTVFLMLTAFIQCWLGDVDITFMIRAHITQRTREACWAITNFISYSLNTAADSRLIVWQVFQVGISIVGDSVHGIGHRVLIAVVVQLGQRHSTSAVLTCFLCIG